MRAAIDAIVADAYGLSAEQYAHVLSTFSHKSYPAAPKICLAAFHELKEIGLDAFTQKYDPYWDVPLNESLPQPVIELPVPDESGVRSQEAGALQNVIDFGEAVAVRETRRPQKKAAEEPVPYIIDQPLSPPDLQPATISLFDEQTVTAAPTLTSLDREVILLARAVQLHAGTDYGKTLGHVKAEKIVHLVEARLGIDLARRPKRDAAGPVDFPQLLRAMKRGRELGAFRDVPQGKSGYQLQALKGVGKTASRIHEAFGGSAAIIDKLITSLLGLKSREVEAIATIYAVWNDLLHAGKSPTDDEIFDAFWAWHPNKRSFTLRDLRTWIAWIRNEKIVPTGLAKLSEPIERK